MSLPGLAAGQKTEQPMACTFDLNQLVDSYFGSNLGMELGDYAGKLQQTVNGNLIRHGYTVEVVGVIDTCCLCCSPQP